MSERLKCEIVKRFSLVERSSDVSLGKMISVWARANGSKVVLTVLYRRISVERGVCLVQQSPV